MEAGIARKALVAVIAAREMCSQEIGIATRHEIRTCLHIFDPVASAIRLQVVLVRHCYRLVYP